MSESLLFFRRSKESASAAVLLVFGCTAIVLIHGNPGLTFFYAPGPSCTQVSCRSVRRQGVAPQQGAVWFSTLHRWHHLGDDCSDGYCRTALYPDSYLPGRIRTARLADHDEAHAGFTGCHSFGGVWRVGHADHRSTGAVNWSRISNALGVIPIFKSHNPTGSVFWPLQASHRLKSC